ncbi:MAG: O-antigen ligase family protein [Planctomycetes bacterium]|nr:O-antigen ligase family protein [Planctomycetota bacterium]
MPDDAASMPAWRGDLSRALLFVFALLLGLFLAVRVSTQQLGLITVDSALATLLALALAGAAWGRSAALPGKRPALPDGVSLALCLWLGLNLLSALRSPNAGAAVPLSMNTLVFVLLLIAGFLFGHGCPQGFRWLAHGLVAMGACESFYGLWVKYVQLPRLRTEAAEGLLMLPDEFSSQIAKERLSSNEIFGTFEIANSYAAFLLLALFAQIGLWIEMRSRRPAGSSKFQGGDLVHLLLLCLPGTAFCFSGSKGAWVAFGAGIWFLLLQSRLSSSRWAGVLRWLTIGGLAFIVLALVLGTADFVNLRFLGASISVRLEYWRTAWRMIASSVDHTLFGVGLGGFGEWMTFYKTPLGTEVKEVHNDWLQLWVELGLLGPLAWGMVWYAILRPRKKRDEPRSAPQPATSERRNHWAVVGGAVCGVGLLYFALGSYTSDDLWALLRGQATADTLRGGIAAVFVPFLFAAAFLIPARFHPDSSAPPGPGLFWSTRAAIGAVLIHQLVDFPLRIPAVMWPMALLGGMLVAERVPRQNTAAQPASPLSHLVYLAVPLLLLALLPADFLVLLNSGSARRSAEIDYSELRELASRKPASDAEAIEWRRQSDELQTSAVRNRQDAFRCAPFDGEAAFDLALAYIALERSGKRKWAPDENIATERSLDELATERLEDARRLRPCWAAVPIMQGHQALEVGLRTLASAEPAEAWKFFQKAEWNYLEGSALYPHAPGFRVLVGDALMLMNRTQEAGETYAEAWAEDKAIFDPNRRLSSIFHDPRPGCLARHDLDPIMLGLIQAAISKIKDERSPAALGLRLRRVLVLAWLRSREAAAVKTSERLKELDRLQAEACADLARSAPDDGHAVLFATAALMRVDRKEGLSEWAAAEEKIRRQRERGEPTTPGPTLSDLRRLLDVK